MANTRTRRERRRALIAAGILPSRGAKPKSGHQIRLEARQKVTPTDEMIRQKAQALGMAKVVKDENGAERIVVPKGFNASVSVEPLDVLLFRKAITSQQYSAAMRLGWLRRVTLGNVGPTMMRFEAMMAERISSEHVDGNAMTDGEREALLERCHERWREAMEQIRIHAPLSIGPLQCLLDRRWCSSPRLERAVTGMEVLVRHWRIS